jgi:NRAMP (natural resistance-associated macrophage protein)-like metal ion transporter
MQKLSIMIRKKFNRLGPGFITGAADDDPSGVATYSIAGAQFGYALNWLSLFLIPMMVSVQEMCARIGMCSGMGLAGVIKKHYSRKLLVFAVGLLLIANVINISADLGIMAASIQMLVGFPFIFWLIIITVFSIGMEIFLPYKKYATYLKWLGLTLLVYVITALITKQQWLEIIKATLIPHISFSTVYLMTMVGFIGTTISPYLFFWQADEEVEEEISTGEVKDFNTTSRLEVVSAQHMRIMRVDTIIGMVFSNIVSAAIVLTTAATLHTSGFTNIATPQQAALALRPLAGNFAFLLFAVGIIGIGLQSIPVLAGGVAYALSEVLGIKEGLGKTLRQAKGFYLIIALATGIGALLNLIGINPMQALYYSAIVNGVISVPLIFIIIKLADDSRVVGKHKTPRLLKIISWITFIFVGLASIAMIINVIHPS